MKKNIIEQELGIPPDYQYRALKSKNFIHSNWHKNKLDSVKHLLKLTKKDSVLDIGIGSGNFELELAKNVKNIVGIDYNTEAVNFAKDLMKRNKIKNVHLKYGDALNLKTLSDKFDFVIMIDVIEHFSDKNAEKVIKDISRLLKKGGKFCLITPNFKSMWITIEWLLDQFRLVPELGGKQHLSKFDPKTLTEILEKCDYKNIKILTFNTFSYLIPNQRLRKSINKWELKNIKYGNLLFVVAEKP